MKLNKLLITDTSNVLALIARVALAIVIFPHGAQKLLGWFGGGGFEGTMGFLTGTIDLPYVIGLLVIIIEFFGSLFVFFGFLTRVAAFEIIANFVGVVLTVHIHAGFFMNWYGQANKTEGLEYFILLFGLAIIVLIAGGGRASIDGQLPINSRK